jgi:TPR repeat protein
MRYIITSLLTIWLNALAIAQDYTPLFNKISTMANNGNVEAGFNLGMLYTNGIGTENNIEKSFMVKMLAAIQGHS